MENRTLKFGRAMMWENVANNYAKLFIDTLDNMNLTDSMVV